MHRHFFTSIYCCFLDFRILHISVDEAAGPFGVREPSS
ncbi:hypothetical protein SAMN05661091_5272 [Paenibacillus uliginis N3/975]|uniref:Uncharacterized protein n=1 Tax=Paenibacillus uliginis N3/975 TaxID=1313296 RepID=A0A1X7HQA2_9BACL|nr:hypothetical protein SAMN05661091_5272 [Paenibacillus uliginis N3/975]